MISSVPSVERDALRSSGMLGLTYLLDLYARNAMQEKEMKTEKYIRKDDPELEEASEYINYLIDAYKQTSDIKYRDAILDAFEGYFRKYVSLMHIKEKGVDINNNDTKNFLRMFMKKEERANQALYAENAGSYVHMIRRILSSFTAEDIYHELIVIFLDLLEKYKPITYKRKNKKHRISFSHYIQVHMRYALTRWIYALNQDAIGGSNWVEYKDYMHEEESSRPFEFDGAITLRDWVWGDSACAPFSRLS